ncbi:MAG TPA: tetratricopeptide repeat protein, partial [Candidatus Melainabacteria bacterium]|nr:tetratricopeptide repeat protein [Candidatus Melainabacteria bacterium]
HQIPQGTGESSGNVTGSISISGQAVPADQVRNIDSGVASNNQLVITYPQPAMPEKSKVDMRLVAAGAAVLVLAAGGFIFSQMGHNDKADQPHVVANPKTYEDFTSSGLSHYSEGRYASAVKELKKANDMARSFPEGDKRKLESWINLGEAQVANDDYKEAESCLNHAALILKGEKQTKGKEYARIQQDLGELRLNSGDYDAAEPCFKTALDIRMSLSGTDKEDAADSLQGLASISIQRRNFSDAIAKLQQAQKLIESSSGKEDRDYVAVITDLARAEQMAATKRDQLPKIAGIYEEALSLGQKVFPPDHPQIGKINLAFATLLFVQGDMDGAESRFNEAIRITTKNGGEKSVDMAQMKASLAILNMKQKRYGGAEQLFAEAIAIGTAKLGETNDAVRRWKTLKAQCEKQRRRS